MFTAKKSVCSDLLVSCLVREGFLAIFTTRRKGPNLHSGQLGIVTQYNDMYICMYVYIYIYIYIHIYNNVKLKGSSGNCCIFLHALIWDSKKPSLSFILPSATNLTYFVLNQNCK